MIDTYKLVLASGAGSVDDTPAVVLESSMIVNGLYITNLHASKELLVKLSNDFDNAPNISPTDYNFKITAGNWLELIAGARIAVWVASEDSSDIDYNYLAVQ